MSGCRHKHGGWGFEDGRPTIAVLGPGGVGGLVAGALTRAGEDVTVVGRESTVALIAERGLRVQSTTLGSFECHPSSAAHLDGDVDILVVAAKAVGLDEALKRVSGSPRLVLPLLNGLDHMQLLRARYDRHDQAAAAATVLAGTIRVEAERVAPGVIRHTSPSVRIEMASARPGARAPTQALAAMLSRAGLPATVRDSEAQVLWSKLVRLNALACTTTAFGLPLGAIRSTPPLRAALVEAVSEGAQVARAEGAQLSARDTLEELERAHPTLTSSMARDVVAGREPELDAIAGAVLRAAARHGLSCPTIQRLRAEIERRVADAPARPGG